jgi:hypothetical protein
VEKTKYHIATFTQYKRGQPKPKCDNFISCKVWPDKFHIVQKLKKFNIEENQISYRHLYIMEKGTAKTKVWQLLHHVKAWQEKFHVLLTKKEVQHGGKSNITLSLLHNVRGDSQSQHMPTFTSCKSVTGQIWCCASNIKKFNIVRRPNITSQLLHNVKGDSQNQLMTTFTSCKSVARQIWCCASKEKEVEHNEKTKYYITTFT